MYAGDVRCEWYGELIGGDGPVLVSCSSPWSAKWTRLSAQHVMLRFIGGGMMVVDCVWRGDWCDCFCKLHSSVSMFVVVGPPAIICLLEY